MQLQCGTSREPNQAQDRCYLVLERGHTGAKHKKSDSGNEQMNVLFCDENRKHCYYVLETNSECYGQDIAVCDIKTLPHKTWN